MRVVTNQIDPDTVRTVNEDGTDFLVAPIVLMRSMWLNGPQPNGPDVYVPNAEVEASTPRWDGIAGPIDHPTATEGGQTVPISINDDRATVPVVSEVRNPETGESRGKTAVIAELWINVEAAKDVGGEGERVVTRLQNGDAIEVSSAYAPGKIVSGVFDGEHREAAALDLQPDHVAILPDSKGKCSLADGCGAGAPLAPAVNQIYVNLADDGTDPEDVDDGPDHVMTDSNGDGELFETLGRKVANALGFGPDDTTTGAESPADDGSDTITNDTMGDKTQELVENHGFDAENLPDEDTECFGRIYDSFTANAEEKDEPDKAEQEQTTDEQTTDTPETVDVDELADALADQFVTADDLSDAIGEAIAANAEHNQKAKIAEQIVANTDEYEDTDAVLEDYPTVKALRAKLDAERPARTAHYGASRPAKPAANRDEPAGFSPVASVHAGLTANAESDD